MDHYMIDDAINIGLQPRGFYKVNIMERCYLINEELEDSEIFPSTEVLDWAYSSVTVKEVTSQQAHLSKEEQTNLRRSRHSTLPSSMENWDTIHTRRSN